MSEAIEWYSGKRVLITGGLGFIGANLARELVSAGANVLLVDSLIPEYGGNLRNIAGLEGRLEVNISDVRDEHSLKYLVRGQDVVFNLAGQTSHLDSMTDPNTDLEINCRSQLFILEACRHNNPDAKVVFASTRQVYGRPVHLPVTETHPVAPVDVNGINKTAGEQYHLVYGQVYGIPVAVLRLTNTYGPRMRVRDARQTFLGFWFRQVLNGEPLLIFGNGTQLRDFNYVSDAVDAFLRAGSTDVANGRVYNLGSSEVVSLRELAEQLVLIERGATYELVPFPPDREKIDIGDYFSDYTLIKQELGWEPRVSLGTGLRLSLDFYRAEGTHYWDDAK
jgi:UDP-glucose 4-epimerase